MIQSSIREILLLGHRQAFTWIDEWFNMTLDDVRAYEKRIQDETNLKVMGDPVSTDAAAAVSDDGEEEFEDALSS